MNISNHLKKGCVLFAAFFMLTACENNSQPAAEQKNKLIQSVDKSISSTEKNDIEENKQETKEKIADAFLTTDPKVNPEQSQFSCEDSIYLAIKFANQEPKLEQIQVTWTDPNDTEREKNDFPFFVSENESLAWASLKLHRSVGAGLLQWVNPAAGMEEFIGTWTVKVTVGEIVNETLNFEVLC